jgi:outer membrane protein assembly factor BamB
MGCPWLLVLGLTAALDPRPAAQYSATVQAVPPASDADENEESKRRRNPLGFPLEQAWTARLEAPLVGGPHPVGRELLALTGDGEVLGLDVRSGEQVWKFHVGSPPVGAAVLAGKRLVIAGKDAVVTALDPNGPDVLWQAKTPSSPTAAPVVAGDSLVLIGLDSGRLLALSAEDGHEVWSFSARGPLLAPPAVDQDHVYLGDGRGSVYRLAASSGEQQWRAATGGAIPAMPLVAGDALLLGSSDDHAYAFALRDGKQRWKTRLGADLMAPPVALGDLALFSCLDGRLYFLRQKDGRRVFDPFLYFRLPYAPLIANSMVFIAPLSNQLAGIDPATGQLAGTFELGALAASPLSFARDTLFVGLGDRRLLAVRRMSADKRRLLEASQAVQTKLLGRLPYATSVEEERYSQVLRSFDQALRDGKVDSAYAGRFLERLEKLEPDKGFVGHEDDLTKLLEEVRGKIAVLQQELWKSMAADTIQAAVVPLLPRDLPEPERAVVLQAFERLLLATYAGRIPAAQAAQFIETYKPLVGDGDVTADDLKVLAQAIDRLLAAHSQD